MHLGKVSNSHANSHCQHHSSRRALAARKEKSPMPFPHDADCTFLESKDLFVYLSWQTRGGVPMLADNQVQQATCQAIGTHTRLRRCRLLAIRLTESRILTVFRFPASLSVSSLAQISMAAAGEAVANLHRILYARHQTGHPLWERDYVLKTLNAEDIVQPKSYLRRRVQEMEE